MYVPDHFRPTDDDVATLLANLDAADLITPTADGLLATFLPLIHEPAGASAEAGRAWPAHGARRPQQPPMEDAGDRRGARDRARSRCLRLAGVVRHQARARPRGPDVELRDGPPPRSLRRPRGAGLDRAQRPRPRRAPRGRKAEPWSVDDAPERYVEGQLRAIVGVEVVITRIEAKLKLSQNRSKADVDGAIDGLAATGEARSLQMAALMRTVEDGRER